jgi:hypothetical protein
MWVDTLRFLIEKVELTPRKCFQSGMGVAFNMFPVMRSIYCYTGIRDMLVYVFAR